MAKKIKNPIEVRAIFYVDETGAHIHEASVLYGISCEHELEEKRTLFLLHSTEIGNCTKDFVEEALRQADVHESILEEDSLLEYDAQGNGHISPL